MKRESASEHHAFLTTDLAGRGSKRFALAVVLGSATLFVAALPYAKIPLAQVPAFIAAYESALIICDLITAVLLFGQYNYLRSRAVLVLAAGYLFTAFIALSHALTYPNLFAPAGLLGAGPQSTAWLYMFWHGGFPLFVIAYAVLANDRHATRQARPRTGIAVVSSVAAILAAACGLTLLATAGQQSLPAIMQGNRYTPAMIGVVSSAWVLSFIALYALWRRRPHTVLALWLMAVMCAWIFDIALSAVFNASRYDVGFYVGRVYGLLTSGFVLIVLLFENIVHYARLSRLSSELTAANTALERLSLYDELTGIANRRCFDGYLADQIAVARRYKRTLALVLCDVDAFKAYNDRYGHQAGDECLKQIAAALRSCCRRPADMVARYGGEEFAIILPDTERPGATQVAEAARAAIAELQIPHGNSTAAEHVTISGGVAVLLRKTDMSAQQLIAAADQSLYQAKHLGRDRMVEAEPEAEVL